MSRYLIYIKPRFDYHFSEKSGSVVLNLRGRDTKLSFGCKICFAVFLSSFDWQINYRFDCFLGKGGFNLDACPALLR